MLVEKLAAMILAGTVAAVPGGVPAAAAAAPALPCSPGGPDFDRDGCADLAVGDPGATVDGIARAGRVTVLYGGAEGSGASGELRQGSGGVDESPETDDGFGAVLAAMDVNDDGYTDLIVGVPSESVGGAADAGVIHVVFGSPGGLGFHKQRLLLQQGQWGIPGVAEAGDRFGAAVTANPTTMDDLPARALAYGVPGEDVESMADAGSAGVITFLRNAGLPESTVAITQHSPGIGGGAEAGDRFGAAVQLFQGPGGFSCPANGAEGLTLVVGAPGEDLDGRSDAGMVHVAQDLTTDTTLSQGLPNVAGELENGDQFGASLALTSFCEHDGPSHVELAVGVPGEDIGTTGDAGMMHLFTAGDDPFVLSQRWSISQNATDVEGTAEAGDRFGAVLTFGSSWHEGLGNPLVVGIPGEDIDAHQDAGGIQVFGDQTTAPGNGDVFRSQPDLGRTPQAGERFGAALATRHDILFVGVPDDVTYAQGAVHGIPWTAVFGAPAAGILLTPGAGSSPGSARFGAGLT
jgi:FG-GAP repeat protein